MKMAKEEEKKRRRDEYICTVVCTNRFDMIGVLFITSCGQESFPRDKFSR